MACIDENTVIAFFASPRSGARAEHDAVVRRVDAHAAECKACRDLLAAYAAMNAADGNRVTEPEAPSVHPATPPFEPIARGLATAHAARRVGQVVGGKWHLDRLLGIGGMAIVFAATHRNGKRVAIKMMRPELVVHGGLVERFLREGYAANLVGHRGAVAVHDDARTDDGIPFLVMDLLEGRTLRERLDTEGPLDVPSALRVIDAVLDTLAAAHSKGIVHRDVKPENLFETDDGAICILDFGIARLLESSDGADARARTQSGVTMGTVGYMPPEQARGQSSRVDGRSDLWAVGATAYALVTGRAVHEATTHNEALLLAMTQPARPVREAAPHVPEAIAAILDKALAFAPDARWQSAESMRAAVRDARDALPTASDAAVPTPRLVAPRRRPSRAVAVGVAASVALALAVSMVTATRGTTSQPPRPGEAAVAYAEPAEPRPHVEPQPSPRAEPTASSSPEPTPLRALASKAPAPKASPKRQAPAPTAEAPIAPASPVTPAPLATVDPLGPRT